MSFSGISRRLVVRKLLWLRSDREGQRWECRGVIFTEESDMKKQRRWLLVFGRMCLTIFLMVGGVRAQSTATKKETVSLSEKAERGKRIFQDACFLCHAVDSERVKPVGPSLDGLFKQTTLVTGKPVNAENVKEAIKMGPTPGMPGFRYTFSQHEI